MALDLPEAPAVDGFTFQYWQVVSKNISTDKTIRLQAVYEPNDPTDVENGIGIGDGHWQKFIKNGNLYILKDEFIYTINGTKVESRK